MQFREYKTFKRFNDFLNSGVYDKAEAQRIFEELCELADDGGDNIIEIVNLMAKSVEIGGYKGTLSFINGLEKVCENLKSDIVR